MCTSEKCVLIKKSMQFWSSTSKLHRFYLLLISLSSLLIFYAQSVYLANKGLLEVESKCYHLSSCFVNRVGVHEHILVLEILCMTLVKTVHKTIHEL